MKKWGIAVIILLVLLVAGGYWWTQHKQQEKPTGYTLGKVETGKIAGGIDATGTVEPVKKVDLSASISGKLRQVLVKENEKVQAGQVLAVIESKTADSQLSQAQSILANKKSRYERYQQLYQEGAVAYQTMADAQMDYETAAAAYEKAEADTRDTVITSPLTGIVIGEPMKEGETVSQGLASQMIIVRVADLSEMQIRLLVDETDIGQVHEGQQVTFTVDAYPGRDFHGKVTDISRQPSDSKSASVIYYTVYVAIDQADLEGLYPSMTARAVIHGKQSDHALIVPITSLRNDKEGQFVYRKQGKGFEKVHVQVGVVEDNRVEILSGLQKGDEIVVSGSLPEEKIKAEGKRNQRLHV